jgi:hypothetical protein
VEKELGNQSHQSRSEADLWTRGILKDLNCMMDATLRTRRFFRQGRIEARKMVTQFGTSSLLIPLEGSLRKCINYSSPLWSCSRFGENDSCKRIRPESIPDGWLPCQLSDAPETSRVKLSRDLLQILEDHRELQFDGIAIGDESRFQL